MFAVESSIVKVSGLVDVTAGFRPWQQAGFDYKRRKQPSIGACL
jgi:hypothetical protein